MKDEPDDRDPSAGQVSEGPSGAAGEAASGGADAVPDTPDALPREENEPTRHNQPDYPPDGHDQQA